MNEAKRLVKTLNKLVRKMRWSLFWKTGILAKKHKPELININQSILDEIKQYEEVKDDFPYDMLCMACGIPRRILFGE